MPSIQYLNQSAPFWDFVAELENQFTEPKKNTPAHDGPDQTQGPSQGSSEPHHGRPCAGQRGGRRYHGRGFPGHYGGPFGTHPFAQFLSSQLGSQSTNTEDDSKDFQPPVDVFVTPSSYHVHVSLPGAKKEDVGVNYNADKSELSIAGVVYRPGDEEFLKNLDLAERKVGVFDRKVKLGNERNPAEVDAEAITAKMEDGVLRVEIPKVEKDYVEVKKVDIE